MSRGVSRWGRHTWPSGVMAVPWVSRDAVGGMHEEEAQPLAYSSSSGSGSGLAMAAAVNKLQRVCTKRALLR